MSKKAQNPVIFLFFFVFLMALLGFGVFIYTEFKKVNTVVEPTKNKTQQNYSDLYPNREIVTGDILERNKSIICKTGYSSTVRNVSLSLRKRVFARDGVEYPQPYGTYELDHWVSLQNGGSNDESNLFVQFEPYYKWKDRTENIIHKVLCSTNMSVEIASDLTWIWYDIYKNNSIVYDYINDS